MNIIENKKIAVIGGGPGGLTLARILQMRGADVTVYERDLNKDARAKGATLDLHEESGLKALQEAGLMDAFRANYRPGADKLRIMDKDATIVWDEHAEVEEKGWNRPEIDRGPLQELLLESLRPGTVVWNSRFAAMKPQGDGWELEFKNAASVYADLVIGADGASSKIRPYLTQIRPFYTGMTMMEGAVHDPATACPKMNDLLKGGKIFAFGDEQMVVVSSKGDGSFVFYTSCKIAEGWARECGIDFADRVQVLAWFKREFSGWDAAWYEMFEQADGAFIPRQQYCMPLDQNWEAQPNLTMLGDAAHLMPPTAGEGVNMAMQDGLELALALAGEDFADTQSAIAAYEQQMRTRAGAAAKDSLIANDMLHSTKALDFMMNLGIVDSE